MDPDCTGEYGNMVTVTIQIREIKKPQYPEGEAIKKHLQHSRLRDPNNSRPSNLMPWKEL